MLVLLPFERRASATKTSSRPWQCWKASACRCTGIRKSRLSHPTVPCCCAMPGQGSTRTLLECTQLFGPTSPSVGISSLLRTLLSRLLWIAYRLQTRSARGTGTSADPCGLGPTQVTHRSRLYESAPAYITDQPRFLNGAVVVATRLPPLELLDQLKTVEARCCPNPLPRSGAIAVLTHLGPGAVFDRLLSSQRLPPRTLDPVADLATALSVI